MTSTSTLHAEEKRDRTPARTRVKAYAAMARGHRLQPWSYEPAPRADGEVDVAVTHCGICHTDVHLIDNDFGLSNYPLVPGHEIIGTVTAVDGAAGSLRVGRRVGVGWQRGACEECEWCRQGLHNLCAGSRPTPLAGHGGFATSVRVDRRFAIPIP
jgi:uncharacterized zinc-type alcohol dehydrogenase-like protein